MKSIICVKCKKSGYSHTNGWIYQYPGGPMHALCFRPWSEFKGEFLGLTREELNRFTSGVNRTWDAIGGDCLDANNSKDYSRLDMIEISLDADFLLMYGGEYFRNKGSENKEEWKEFYYGTIRPWLDKNYMSPAFKKLMKQEFHYDWYGR